MLQQIQQLLDRLACDRLRFVQGAAFVGHAVNAPMLTVAVGVKVGVTVALGVRVGVKVVVLVKVAVGVAVG